MFRRVFTSPFSSSSASAAPASSSASSASPAPSVAAPAGLPPPLASSVLPPSAALRPPQPVHHAPPHQPHHPHPHPHPQHPPHPHPHPQPHPQPRPQQQPQPAHATTAPLPSHRRQSSTPLSGSSSAGKALVPAAASAPQSPATQPRAAADEDAKLPAALPGLSSSELLSALHAGCLFRKHEWNGRGSGVLSLDVFMWLVGEGRASTLYWCSAFVASARPQLERQSLPLRSVTDFMLSKKTDVLRATKAEDRRCFALIANTGQSLHMEAPTTTAAQLWRDGLMACLSSTGKQIKRISQGGGSSAAALSLAAPNSAAVQAVASVASVSAPSTPVTPGGQPSNEPVTPPRPLPSLMSPSQATLPAALAPSPSSASSFNTVDFSATPDLSSLLSSSASLSSLCVSPPLSVLVAGSAFKIYYINSRSVPAVTDVFLFLTLEQPTPTHRDSASPAPAAVLGPVPTAASSSSSSSSSAAAGDSVPCLYWCPVSSSSVRKRVVSQRLLVSSIVRLSVGKETSILRHSVAGSAVAEHCLSIIGRALSLNLEATNVQTRVQWQTGLTLLMQHMQQRQEQGSTPPSEPLLIQPSPMSPRSADIGPASPVPQPPPPSSLPPPSLSFMDAENFAALPSSDPRHPRHSAGLRPNPIDTSMPRHTPEPVLLPPTAIRTLSEQHSASVPSQQHSSHNYHHTPDAPASNDSVSSTTAFAAHTPIRPHRLMLEPPSQAHTLSSNSWSRQSPAPPSPASDNSARLASIGGSSASAAAASSASVSDLASASDAASPAVSIFLQPPLPFTLWAVSGRPQQSAHGDEVVSSAVSVHVNDTHLHCSDVLAAPHTPASRAAVAAPQPQALPLSSITQLSTSRDLPLSLASRIHPDRLLLVFTSAGCLTLEGRTVEARDTLFKHLHATLLHAGRLAQHITPNSTGNGAGPVSTAAPAADTNSTFKPASLTSAALPTAASQLSFLPPSAPSHQRSRSADLNSVNTRAVATALSASHPAASAAVAASSMSLAAAVAYLAQGQLVSRYAESVESNGHNSVHRVPIMLYTSTTATPQQPTAVSSPTLSPPATPALAASSFHLCWCAPAAFASSSGPPAPSSLNSLPLHSVAAVLPNRDAGLLRSLLIKASPDRCIAVLTAQHGNLFIEAQSREQRDRLQHSLLAILAHIARYQQQQRQQQQQAEPSQGAVAAASSPSLSSSSASTSTRSPSSLSSASLPPSPSMAERGDSSQHSPSPHQLSAANPLSAAAAPRTSASPPAPSGPATLPASSSTSSASSSSSSSSSAVASPSSLSSSAAQSDFRHALSLLCAGQQFTLYFLLPTVRRSDLPLSSSTSPSVFGAVSCRAVFVWFESALGDETPGSLYWCAAGSRVMDKSCRLQLNRTKRMALGRESTVWQSPVAAKVPANRCLSITAADGQTLHLEAPSGEVRDAWQKSLHLLLIRNGLQAVESKHQPVAQRESGGKPVPNSATSNAHSGQQHSTTVAAGQATEQAGDKGRRAGASTLLQPSAGAEKDEVTPELKVSQPAQQPLSYQPPHITAAAVRRPAPSPPLQPTWHEDDTEQRPALPAAPAASLTALALSDPPPLPPPPPAADLLPLSASSSAPASAPAVASSASASSPAPLPLSPADPVPVPGGSRALPLSSPSRSSSVSRTIQFSDPTEWFLLQSKIGEGSYGSVYRALDVRDESLVAIKVLPFDGRDNSRASLKLRKEIKILRRCESPYIVGYRGAFQKGSSVWIVMQMCAGGSLSDIMHCCGHTFSERQVGAIMRMALHGLAALHRVGVIHRDIKGGNILADSSGICKLADFGVSSTINSSLGRQRTVIGTPHWMAPEVLLSDEYNELADVWSLGITAYELAVGEPPHAKVHSMRAAVKIPQSAPPTLPDPETWSGEFHNFLAACLVKDPARRPSAEQLLQHPFIARAAEPTVLVPMIAQREREAGNAHRKPSNVGSVGSLDSLDEAAAAPLSKAPQQQQQQQQSQAAHQSQQSHQLQQAPARQEQRADSSPASMSHHDGSTADSQRTQIRNEDNIDRTQEHWNNVDDEHSDSHTQPQPQQLQHSNNHTRTLPHPVVLPADIDTSPPRRLHRTGTTQQPQPVPLRPPQPHSERPPDLRAQQAPLARPQQHSPSNARDVQAVHLHSTLRSSSSSPALSQQPSGAGQPIVASTALHQRTVHAAAASPSAAQQATSTDSSRHFFQSLPSAAAHSSGSPSSSSSSASPSSSRSDRYAESDAVDGEWSSTPLRRADGRSGSISRVTLHVQLKQYERTPSWPATGTTTPTPT